MAFRALSGVAVDAVARCGRTAFAEAALFTHRGLSGPAILQISSYWRHGEAIALDMLPGQRCRRHAARRQARAARARSCARSWPNCSPPASPRRSRSPGELANLPDKALAALGAQAQRLAVRARTARKASPRPR